jgi:hypothetical protein
MAAVTLPPVNVLSATPKHKFEEILSLNFLKLSLLAGLRGSPCSIKPNPHCFKTTTKLTVRG